MNWLRFRITKPLLGLLKKGLSPRGLAWSVAVGVALGVFPMVGVTTVLCVVAAQVFRLNQPAILLANGLAYPLQLALLIPFFRLGARLFGVQSGSLSIPAMLDAMKIDPIGALVHLRSMIWHATVIWAFLALPAMVVMAFLLRPVFEAAGRRFRAEDRGPG